MPRHRTMRALIDWSYNLLSPAEQRLFGRLAVCAGGCTHEIAAALNAEPGSDELDTLDLLSSLVDKSLVIADFDALEPRYRLLESTRQYAREKLAQQDDAHDVAHRHAVAYTSLAASLEREYDRETEAAWIARAAPEMQNWLAALQWTLVERADVELGQRLVSHLRPVWQDSSLATAQEWLRIARDLVGDGTDRAVAANLEFTALAIAQWFGEWESTVVRARELLDAFRAIGDELGAARTQLARAESLLFLGRVAESRPLLEECLQTARILGNQRLLGHALERIAAQSAACGDYEAARAHLAEALALYRSNGNHKARLNAGLNLAEAEFRAGDVATAIALSSECTLTLNDDDDALLLANAWLNLSAYHIACDRWYEARRCAVEALHLNMRMDRQFYVAFALQHLAAIAVLSPAEVKSGSQFKVATKLLGFVDHSIIKLGTAREYTEQQEYDRVVAALRAALPAAELTNLLADGAAITQAHAIDLGRSLAIAGGREPESC